MSNLSSRLMIKFGLPPGHPTNEEVIRWLEKVMFYINNGFQVEEAGHKAAQETFYGYRTYRYSSQADSIETLLMEAKKK